MSILGSLNEEGRSARRGVILLFGFTGWLLTWWWREYGPDYLRLVLGIACIGMCAGLWFNFRWARWLALGACFLAVVIAFSMPVILELWRPFRNYEGGPQPAVFFTCATAAAIGVIGYKGLGYFRSAAAWQAFAGDPQHRDALARESSATVVISAGCLAVLLGLVAVARGVQGPEVSLLADASAKRPDLVVNSLCMSGTNLVQAEVQNRGTGQDGRQYTLTYSDLRDFGRRGAQTSVGLGPAPGQSTYVALDNAVNQSEQDGVRQRVNVKVDAGDDIRESDEGNNEAHFTIVYHYLYPGNLPACP